MLKALLTVLLLQAVATLAEENCNNETIISEKTTDLDALIGNWSVVHVWDKEISLNSLSSSFCIKFQLSETTEKEVNATKNICKYSKLPFDWENAKYKLSTPSIPFLKDRLISINGDQIHILQNCYFQSRVEVRQVPDNYVLLTYPEFKNTTELVAKVIPTIDELKCVADNIDVTKGRSGHAVCFK